MKKFLITFVIGVVFMAIGTTSLIFEINDFERIDGYTALMEDDAYYKSEKFQLKDDETIHIGYVDGEYIPYEINYDDRLKDEVIISIMRPIAYKVKENGIVVYGHDSYFDDDFTKGMNTLEFFMEGLKNRKLYDFNNTSIIITLSHENRERIREDYNVE